MRGKPRSGRRKSPSFTGHGTGIKFLRALLDNAPPHCVTWPLFRDTNGYGRIGFNGNMEWAHRRMCFLAHGDPPSSAHEAAHSCGNGIKVASIRATYRGRRRPGTSSTADTMAQRTMPIGARKESSVGKTWRRFVRCVARRRKPKSQRCSGSPTRLCGIYFADVHGAMLPDTSTYRICLNCAILLDDRAAAILQRKPLVPADGHSLIWPLLKYCR